MFIASLGNEHGLCFLPYGTMVDVRRVKRCRWPGLALVLAMVGSATMSGACVGDIGGGDEPADEVGQRFCGADVPFVRRLTLDEYAATVEALLEVDLRDQAAEALPADLYADGFSNTANALIVTLDHVESYAALAEFVATEVDLEALADDHGCTSFGDDCERELTTHLATELFRHPPEAEEVDALLHLFEDVQTEGDDFTVAVGLVLEALLQSPRFLYRIEKERGEGSVALDGYEIASRLSYYVWGSPPDEDLLAAAKGLHEDAAIEAQVDRMLDDPRARDNAQRFLVDWLDLHRLDNLQRDEALFPDWDPALGVDMKAETVQFFTHLALEEERPLAELFDAQLTFVTPELATHYGFDEPEADGRVSLADLPERGGLLTQGAIASLGGNTSSMVTRGLYILENILCGHLADPPPGVDTTPPEVTAETPQRTLSEERVDNAACGGCHYQIEPVAWGIERFDATGRHTTEDRFGNPLEQDGTVVLEEGQVDFETTAELGELLAGSERVAACMSRKSTQYALGRPLELEDRPNDQCIDDEVTKRFLASSGTYRDLVLAIALSTSFRHVEGQK